MSLNNDQMLPARVRNMRQMHDVLNAEDIILAEIERTIDEMYQRASLLHEEIINEEWLENKLSEKTGAGVDVTGYAERLLAEIVLNVSELQHIDMPDVRKFLNKWVPAHLMYKIILLVEYGLICPEEFSMTEMALGFESQFCMRQILDEIRCDCGAAEIMEAVPGGLITEKYMWQLDGSYLLNGERMLDAERREEEL